MDTGSPTLHKRLPSLRIQARSLGYSAALADRAGSQSAHKFRLCGLSSGRNGFPSEPAILLAPPTKIRTISIIQGWVEHHGARSNSLDYIERLGNILNDIVDMLYAYRYSDKTFRNPRSLQFIGVQLPMGG